MESEQQVSSKPNAAESVTHSRLFASLYAELRQLAERQLRRNAGAPVSPTTLLHEAYLGMRGREAVFPDRERFIGYAARVMRGLIIDFVRDRRALKRGELSEPAAASTSLLPVVMAAPCESINSTGETESAPSGAIHIEFPGRAMISVERGADPSLLRSILESLRK